MLLLNYYLPAAFLFLSTIASGADLLTVDGRWVSGDARAARGRLTVGRAAVPFDRIISLRLSEAAGSGSVEQALLFRSRDMLTGDLGSIQSERITFESTLLGSLKISSKDVRVITLEPMSLANLVLNAEGPAGAKLSNGDFVEGKVIWISSRTIGIKVRKRILKLPRERTTLVRFPSGKPPAPEGRSLQFARLVDGSRISGELVSISNGRLELKSKSFGTANFEIAGVRKLWSEGGPLVPLSTLKPVEVRQIAQFDETFRWRPDRNLVGAVLSIGGREYERGLGCHSRCELEYHLGGKWSAFVAEIGIDDYARPRGEVVCRVQVDGKTRFESGLITGRDQPKTLRADIRGARRLRLVVDFGPNGSSSGDHADWGLAVLVR